jgi:hypothetical protein
MDQNIKAQMSCNPTLQVLGSITTIQTKMDQNRKVTWIANLLYKFQVQITTTQTIINHNKMATWIVNLGKNGVMGTLNITNPFWHINKTHKFK